MRNKLSTAPKPVGREAAGKEDLVNFVAVDLDTTKRDARLIVDSVAKGIVDIMQRRRELRIPNLGGFRSTVSAARPGRNPRTGEPVAIASGLRVSFRAAKFFKTALGDKKSTKP
jgi:DNA-binding protein HU-beta